MTKESILIPGDRKDGYRQLLMKERLLIPGDRDTFFDPGKILVFDNCRGTEEVITLKEAEKKHWEVTDLEKVVLALKDLPTDMLSYERNPASGEWGWHAPNGHAIKIEGSFSITQTEHTQGCGNFGPPCPSKELFPKSRGYEGKFNEFLIKTNGDRKKAFRKLLHYIREELDAGYTLTGYYPEFFIGKWLFIESNEGETAKLGDIPAGITLNIATEAKVYENNDFFEEMQTTRNDGKETVRTLFPASVIDYTQTHATAVLGSCKITLIKRREKRLKLVTVKHPSLIIPIGSETVCST